MSARRPPVARGQGREPARRPAGSARPGGSPTGSARATSATRPSVSARQNARTSTAGRSRTPTARTPEVARPVRTTVWPRVLTVRAMVLFVVALLAFVLVFPTARSYFGQSAQLQALRAEVAAAQDRTSELEFQVSRWQDQAYVASQARERLAYVYPGETAYRVLDPELAEPAVNPDTGKGVAEGPVDVGFADTPWYGTIWNSLTVAGEVTVDEQAAEPTDPADPAVPPADDAPTTPGTDDE